MQSFLYLFFWVRVCPGISAAGFASVLSVLAFSFLQLYHYNRISPAPRPPSSFPDAETLGHSTPVQASYSSSTPSSSPVMFYYFLCCLRRRQTGPRALRLDALKHYTAFHELPPSPYAAQPEKPENGTPKAVGIMKMRRGLVRISGDTHQQSISSSYKCAPHHPGGKQAQLDCTF